jgi:hypothetical protein
MPIKPKRFGGKTYSCIKILHILWFDLLQQSMSEDLKEGETYTGVLWSKYTSPTLAYSYEYES